MVELLNHVIIHIITTILYNTLKYNSNRRILNQLVYPYLSLSA